jgi:hypothetical protein
MSLPHLINFVYWLSWTPNQKTNKQARSSFFVKLSKKITFNEIWDVMHWKNEIFTASQRWLWLEHITRCLVSSFKQASCYLFQWPDLPMNINHSFFICKTSTEANYREILLVTERKIGKISKYNEQMYCKLSMDILKQEYRQKSPFLR